MIILFKNLSRISGIGILSFTVLTAIFCTEDYNPFSDPNNADAYVTSWTFADRDSVSIFETGTFRVEISAREVVDSIVIKSPQNRYWTDTVVKNLGSDYAAYSFSVSFYDTGYDTTTLFTHRSNGDVLSKFFHVRVYNPLLQENVNDFFGDTVLLFTINVPDKKDVVYHWNLGGTWNGLSPTNKLPVVFPLFSPINGAGKLWVSDVSGNIVSPPVFFTYAFNDVEKPVIECVNVGFGSHGDTIVTGDTLFQFKVIIVDAGSAEVESCSVNGRSFDFVNRGSHVYTKFFPDVPDSMDSESALALDVFALDSRLFGNRNHHTYYVKFDPAGPKTDNVTITFYKPDAAVVRTDSRRFFVHGTAQSASGDTVSLVCSVNDHVVPPPDTIRKTGDWGWFVALDSTFTTVTLTAYDRERRIVASAQRVIVFDANAVDSIKPMIWEVSSGDRILGDIVHTPMMQLPLKIIAFDDGAGIAHLIVNNDSLYVDSASYIWNWTTRQLEHSDTGSIIRIVAVDGNNNTRVRTIVIRRNSIPELPWGINIPEVCCAESSYVDTLKPFDGDGDLVDTKPVKLPAGMTFNKEGVINWKPVVRPDTDLDTLVIRLEDRYEEQIIQRIFSVKPCKESEIVLHFATSEQDFPGLLQTGERMRIALSVDTMDGVIIPRWYSARFLDNGLTLLDKDSAGLLVWVPSLADTGVRKLMVTVGFGARVYDTLLPAIRVVPKNQFPCSLSVEYSGTQLFPGHLDMFSHAAPETLSYDIHDKDHPLTESYMVSIRMGTLRSAQLLNQRSFQIILDRDTSKLADTIVAVVLDRTGFADTVSRIVHYFNPGTNSPPYLTGDPGFPDFFCIDSTYRFQFSLADPNGDVIKVVAVHAPAGMSISESGQVQWTPSMNEIGDDSLIIRLTDATDFHEPAPWPLAIIDCDNMPKPVAFKTVVGNFPHILQAEVDSLSLQLEIVSGTGVRPFKYLAFQDDGLKILDDAVGKLFWIPTSADTGVRTMTITVADRYHRTDTLLPQITVVPRNRNQCRLDYSYSGPRLPSGQLTLFSTAQPESAQFVIYDDDHPATEKYEVNIVRRAQSSSLSLNGDMRSFSVKVASPVYSTVTSDTFVVSVKDATGTVDTVRLVVRYPLDTPDEIPQLDIALDASTGVSASFMGDRVSKWSEGSGFFNSGISQQESDRQPVLEQNAVNGNSALLFDHLPDNDDDGLFDANYRQWADTAFTVFIVFSPRTHPTLTRQTLVSTNTADGLGLGIACDQTIGIFNDIGTQGCADGSWASTGLTVMPMSWNVATFQSDIGIKVDGNINVQAWLNGVPALQPMEMRTQSGAGLAVGTGSDGDFRGNGGYNGSFDGWIASIIIYQRSLSEDERYLIEQYLGNQYGIMIQ